MCHKVTKEIILIILKFFMNKSHVKINSSKFIYVHNFQTTHFLGSNFESSGKLPFIKDVCNQENIQIKTEIDKGNTFNPEMKRQLDSLMAMSLNRHLANQINPIRSSIVNQIESHLNTYAPDSQATSKRQLEPYQNQSFGDQINANDQLAQIQMALPTLSEAFKNKASNGQEIVNQAQFNVKQEEPESTVAHIAPPQPQFSMLPQPNQPIQAITSTANPAYFYPPANIYEQFNRQMPILMGINPSQIYNNMSLAIPSQNQRLNIVKQETLPSLSNSKNGNPFLMHWDVDIHIQPQKGPSPIGLTSKFWLTVDFENSY